MKLICLLGSPRREGNSATIADRLVAKARELGAEAEVVYLNGLNYRGCQACYACKTSADHCVVNDAISEVLVKVQEADALVVATPVYYGDVTGQLKNFIDRTFSYLVPDYAFNPVKTRLSPGKRVAFVFTQGHPDETKFDDVYPRYASFFQWLGYPEAFLIRGCGLSERSTVTKREHIMEMADNVAKSLVGCP